MQITVPTPYVVEAKPAMEWLLGEPVQKVSPRYAHARMQLLIGNALGAWAIGRGRVGPEWRFWLAPGGEPRRYLVPDLAYLSYDRLPRERRGEDVEEPRVAPDAVVEIISPTERNLYVQHKLDVYLRSGTRVVILVDPQRRIVTVHDAEQTRTLDAREVLTHPALPEFSLDLAALFADLDA
jgi:Uma2 family endonuclease